MKRERRLQVEVYSHGGWWKDDLGLDRPGPALQASRGPMATVAAVANGFGTEGWQLTDLVSAHHSTYLLTFEPAAAAEDAERVQAASPDARPGRPRYLGPGPRYLLKAWARPRTATRTRRPAIGAAWPGGRAVTIGPSGSSSAPARRARSS